MTTCLQIHPLICLLSLLHASFLYPSTSDWSTRKPLFGFSIFIQSHYEKGQSISMESHSFRQEHCQPRLKMGWPRIYWFDSCFHPSCSSPRRLTHLSQSESRRSVFLRVEWNLERMRRGGRGEEEMLGEWTNLDRTDPINISNGPSATFFLPYDGEISFSFQRDQENQPVKLDPKDRRIRRWESQTVCQSFIKSS